MSTWLDITKDTDAVIANNKLAGIASGWDATELTPRIDEAQRYIAGKLSAIFGATLVNSWTRLTVPPRLRDLVAIVGAAYLKRDKIRDYDMSAVEKLAIKEIDDIVAGKADLLNVDGSSVSAAAGSASDQVKCDTSSRTKVFSRTHPSDSDAGDGSLDDFGV